MVFLSKKDIWMGLVIWGAIGSFLWVLYESLFTRINIVSIITMIIIISLLLTIWFNTRYKIEGNQLKISYGVIRKSIALQDIKSIRYTKNPFVAPALSFKRVEINYGKYETIQVSPKEMDKFIIELQDKNPHIQLKD
ncbi:MAG TPA: PH domain-containing protein [Ureibacillus sp.]|nr:PH domain-containing protein [Ureibacillus sp.]